MQNMTTEEVARGRVSHAEQSLSDICDLLQDQDKFATVIYSLYRSIPYEL